jgi:general secretion pathway protein C
MSPRQARIGVDLFTALVIASVCVSLAGLTWRMLGDPGTRLGASPVAARPSAPVDIAPLIALAPFGAAPAAVGGSAVPVEGMTLRGILFAQPRSASSALISLGDTSPVAFGVGQPVGNATIDTIEIDHVVLLSGGSRTILAFPRPQGGAPAPAAPAGSASPAPAPPPTPAPEPVSGATVLKNMGATLSPNGLAVGDPTPPMRMAGLQPGDQIVAINGTPAPEVMRNPDLLKSALANGSARIDVMRAGQRVILSVPVR